MERVQEARGPYASQFQTEPFQKPLFSSDAIKRAGRPSTIELCDPQRPERKRLLIVASSQTRNLLELLERAAPTSGTILLQGESGSGKNLLAQYVHSKSGRSNGPFIHFSAGHHPETLIESELFGHEVGAFTGARSSRSGKIEQADGGTLFIDEVGDLSPSVQLKLHRFFDDQVVERVGGVCQRPIDARVVAATHQDLWALVKSGKFREDLYYRLSVVCLRVPSLRERAEEVPAIAGMLLEELSARHGKSELRWDPRTLSLLSTHSWPGNVRELRNAVERMVILSQSDVLGPEDFLTMGARGPAEQTSAPAESREEGRRRFLEVYQRFAGNRTAIAKALGTSRSQVRRMIERHMQLGSQVDQSH